jgi:Ca2+-binding EF-hand superfamily protein
LRAALVRGRRRIGECFRVLDRNQDGKITKKEFAAALPLLGIDASSKWALDEIFDSIDVVI